MIKNFLIITFSIINMNLGFSQVHIKKDAYIKGNVPIGIKDNDTIYFDKGFLDAKFFEVSSVSSVIERNQFKLINTLSYPHLFTLSFKNERDSILFREGEYFIDESTNYIRVDSSGDCSEINGKTYSEYKNKFIPFFIKNESCKDGNFYSFRFNNGLDFDTKLLEYTVNNPDSYVALWTLVKRINEEGHSMLYEKILQSFSKSIKSQKLWKLLDQDIKNIRIKVNKRFPPLILKTLKLQAEEIKLPKAKYTLIDYWFSRCRPCIESFPKLKEIYSDYKLKGFEIISISVDRTKEIANWKKKIKEEEINWIHYLDENGTESKTDKIFRFPTSFLLNENGELIKKDISLEDLRNLLKENLN